MIPTGFSWQKFKDTLNYLVRSPIRVTSGTMMNNGKKINVFRISH